MTKCCPMGHQNNNNAQMCQYCGFSFGGFVGGQTGQSQPMLCPTCHGTCAIHRSDGCGGQVTLRCNNPQCHGGYYRP